MNYIDFHKYFNDFLFINLADIRNIEPEFDTRRLFEWQKKGYIKKVINNFYIFTDKKLKENEVNVIANKLIEPSYLSLEYALSYYSLIPEIVYWRTSVSTKRTKRIATDIGNFSYQTLKNKLFFGYIFKGFEKSVFKIAEPEKALLDLLYLRRDLSTEADFFEMRFNKEIFKEKINNKKLINYLQVFGSKTLEKRTKALLEYI